MKGVPVRLEIGPKDIENNSCVLVRRDTGEKIPASLDNIEETVKQLLGDGAFFESPAQMGGEDAGEYFAVAPEGKTKHLLSKDLIL